MQKSFQKSGTPLACSSFMELFDHKSLDAIGRKLLKKKETIAIAESVTSGLIQFSFSTIKDASCFFQGGITAFNIGQKFKHLQVDPVHALSVNCVSQRVSEEMAKEVCNQFKSTWGIGITGYATAEPVSNNKVFAFYAIAHKGKIKAKGKINLPKVEPTDVQLFYTNKVISRLKQIV